MSMQFRRGLTLIELLVVLTIMAVGSGVVMISMPPVSKLMDDANKNVAQQIAAARESALQTGRMVTITVQDTDGIFTATALPDGSVIGSPALDLDQFVGRVGDGDSTTANQLRNLP